MLKLVLFTLPEKFSALLVSIAASRTLTKKDTVRSHKSITRDASAVQKASAQKPSQPTRAALAKQPPKAAPAATKKVNGPRLPSAPATKGLQMKLPKVGRKEADIHKRLKKKSPWYSSIIDPLHGADAKIPDETGVETGTLQLVERAVITTNTHGIAGARIISPYVNSAKLNVSQVVAGSNVQYLSLTSTETTLHWGAQNGTSGAWLDGAGLPFEAVSGIQTITNQHRIVSACLIVQPEASLATNDGEYCLFQQPFAIEESGLYNDYVNNYKSVVIPASSNNPCAAVKWYPVARQDWSFKSFVRTNGFALVYDDDNTGAVPFWDLGAIYTCKEEGVRIRVTFVVNYEFIPRDNVLNVLDTSPSPQDAMEVDLVEQWVQDMPVAAPMPQRQAASSPASVEPNHGENDQDTGFGMFFNVISELAPLALGLLL